MSENENSKAALLARSLVRARVPAPRKSAARPDRQAKQQEKKKKLAPRPEQLPEEEPTVAVRLTRTELRALRHSKKVRATSLSFALSQQEKETIKKYCARKNVTVSEWIRRLAFEAMGKPIPKRPPTRARGPYKKRKKKS